MTMLPFDANAVRRLATILADTGLTEIEVETKDGRIRVVRAPAPVAAAPTTTVQVAAPAAVSVGHGASEEANHPGAVRSPMVGVAYLSADPQASPFVVQGQAVTAGQTLLLIEAMKTYNQIKAPRAGTVSRILVASGTPVEYDEPLLILE